VVRLRLLRVLLPLLLFGLAWLVYLSWSPRGPVHSPPKLAADAAEPRANQIWFVEYEGERRAVAGDVERFEQHEDGVLELEGIRDLEIHRETGPPWIVNATHGERHGEVGRRLWHFAERVVFREAEQGVVLTLPELDIDESAGEARSTGEIRFAAPGVSGRAAGLLYGLRGQPGSLARPVFDDARGGRATAREATLWDGLRDVELVGEVVLLQQGERLDCGRLRLWHAGAGRLQRALAAARVWGGWPLGAGKSVQVGAEELEAWFDDDGAARRIRLDGDALVGQADRRVSAASIVAERSAATGGGWTLRAAESVVVQTVVSGAPGLLQADALVASVDGALALEQANADGHVSFASGATLAEADRASFDAGGEGRIELVADERRKARLRHGALRVAGARIVTDPQGRRLRAEERVEASLLPAADGPSTALQLFSADEPVHFVASWLDSRDGGRRLDFGGPVRGWQGERNLAAHELWIDQTTRTMEASGDVATRFPRLEGGGSTSEDDYVQITAGHLRFDDGAGVAVYRGDVRMRMSEGWIEAERIELQRDAATGQTTQVTASGQVRLEFQRTESGELQAPVSGEADRALYEPLLARIRLFGEQSPATVARGGRGGGTTAGRVLAYRLDLGTLEVDSGDQGSASIRTHGP